MILCSTSDFHSEHVLHVYDSIGESVTVARNFAELDGREQVHILLSYGNFDDIITSEDLDQLPNLKWIQLLAAGYDTLPLQEIRDRGIILTTASGVHAIPISEYVIGMILYFYKEIPQLLQNQRKRIFDPMLSLQELYGKTLGVLGTGHIGSEIGKKAKLLGMKTIGCNTGGRPVEGFDRVVSLRDLDGLLISSDVVCSVLPSTPDTIGLINRERISQMRDDAIFINVGRGDLVVESDFIAALGEGKLKGAALDVFQQEPLPDDDPLWELERLIISPHISGRTNQYMMRCADLFLQNYRYYTKGQFDSMSNLVRGNAL